MDIKLLKVQIADTLEAIVEQTQIINEYENSIPQIELDIVLENIRKLYNNYFFLNKVNYKNIEEIVFKPSQIDNNVDLNSENSTLIIEKETKIDTLNSNINITQNSNKIIEQIEINNESLSLQTTPQYTPPIVEQEIFEEISINEKKSTDNKPIELNVFSNTEPKTIADKFKTESTTIHDSIKTNNQGKSVVSKLQNSTVNDLVRAIGINDKFLFIRELFNNKYHEYSDNINKLNSFDNFDEAFTFLDTLKNKYSWNDESDACLKISDLVRRRYQ